MTDFPAGMDAKSVTDQHQVIQFAKAIGVAHIITTASAGQHELLTSLGATKCFDYHDDTVVADIKQYIAAQGLSLKHVFDAVGAPQVADQAASCADEQVIVVTATASQKYKMPFAITEEDITLDIKHGPGRVVIPKRAEDGKKAQSAVIWAVENYDKLFRLPKVTVVEGDIAKAVEAVTSVSYKNSNFGKVVIKHPLH